MQKLYYMGPMFRRERPQKGRYRQFYQIGAEAIGSESPSMDAEVIEMVVEILHAVGLERFQLLINSVGCAKCRPCISRTLRERSERRCAATCAPIASGVRKRIRCACSTARFRKDQPIID